MTTFYELCPICHGTGKSGKIISEEGQPPVEEVCSYCNGQEKVEWGGIGTGSIFYTYEVVECIDDTEYVALSTAQKNTLSLILSCGVVDLAEGTAIKTKLWNMFGAGTTTRANLEALIA